MEFRRDEGEGGTAQRWVDHNLPRCPMCKSGALWEVASGFGQLAQPRWFFRCPNCGVVISTTPDTPVSAIQEPVTVVKAALAVNVRVESVERSEDEDFVGEEFPLAELQEWADEK